LSVVESNCTHKQTNNNNNIRTSEQHKPTKHHHKTKTAVVHIHPLVIMSVADHRTRDQMQQPDKKRSLGALFGRQTGRALQVLESFEITHAEDAKSGGTVKLSFDGFDADLALFKEVFPDYECLGWYTTGKVISAGDVELHASFKAYNERPLFLLMDETVAEDAKELPIHAYYERVHVTQANKTVNEFVEVPFRITPDEAERVTVVHCAKVQQTGSENDSAVVPHLGSLTQAITNLQLRLGVVTEYLQAVHKGQLPKDHAILRQVKGLCSRLPTMNSDEFKQNFLKDYNDNLLVTYLAHVTKGNAAVANVVHKCNHAHAVSRHSGGDHFSTGAGW
jgi:COP9 signalosome complex subunit 6